MWYLQLTKESRTPRGTMNNIPRLLLAMMTFKVFMCQQEESEFLYFGILGNFFSNILIIIPVFKFTLHWCIFSGQNYSNAPISEKALCHSAVKGAYKWQIKCYRFGATFKTTIPAKIVIASIISTFPIGFIVLKNQYNQGRQQY